MCGRPFLAARLTPRGRLEVIEVKWSATYHAFTSRNEKTVIYQLRYWMELPECTLCRQ